MDPTSRAAGRCAKIIDMYRLHLTSRRHIDLALVHTMACPA